MLAVDRKTAMRWLAELEKLNETFVYEMRKEPAVEVGAFVGQVSFNLLRCLRDLGSDEQERALIVEHAAHGMTHAAVQMAYWQEPTNPTIPEQVN
jgi:hypothetical protein